VATLGVASFVGSSVNRPFWAAYQWCAPLPPDGYGFWELSVGPQMLRWWPAWLRL
jgi:hypothetical protein